MELIMFSLFKAQAIAASKQLSTREKASMILETLIESRQAEVTKSFIGKSKLQELIQEFNTYKEAIEHVEEAPGIDTCKAYILQAIMNVQLKAGEEESEELYEAVNETGTKIIDLFNTENPDKQQFNNMPGLAYMPRNMFARDC